MNDKPEMSAEERAKLKAELREEVKEEIRSEFVTTPRELPPTDNKQLLELREKWRKYHNAETYYRLAREEHDKDEEYGVWEYIERHELEFLLIADMELEHDLSDDHPYYKWFMKDNPISEEQRRKNEIEMMKNAPMPFIFTAIWIVLGICLFLGLFLLALAGI